VLDFITIASAIAILVTIIYDHVTGSETAPLASLAIAIASITLKSAMGLALALLAMPLSRALVLVKMVKTSRGAAYHLLLDLIPIALVLLAPLIIVTMSSKVLFIGMSKWVSQLFFATTFLLLLAIIIEPSLALETFSKLLFVKPETVSKIMRVAGHSVGLASILIMVSILSPYGALALLTWIAVLLLRKVARISVRIPMELVPYVIVFTIALLKAL